MKLRLPGLAACFGLVALWVMPAGAQTPGADVMQAATELVALTSGDTTAKLVANMTTSAWPKVEAALRTQYPQMDAATVQDLRGQFENIVTGAINDLMKSAPAIYSKHFTAQELRDVIAFYKTPAGAKTLQMMPQITAEIAAAMDSRSQGLQERINLAFLNTLQQRGLYGR